MFSEIKKILHTFKKGVILIEDGVPAFVIVPFDEYRKNMAPGASSQIDDQSLIQKMIALDAPDASAGEKKTGKGISRENMRGIRLEDLPF